MKLTTAELVDGERQTFYTFLKRCPCFNRVVWAIFRIWKKIVLCIRRNNDKISCCSAKDKLFAAPKTLFNLYPNCMSTWKIWNSVPRSWSSNQNAHVTYYVVTTRFYIDALLSGDLSATDEQLLVCVTISLRWFSCGLFSHWQLHLLLKPNISRLDMRIENFFLQFGELVKSFSWMLGDETDHIPYLVRRSLFKPKKIGSYINTHKRYLLIYLLPCWIWHKISETRLISL